MTEKQSQLYRYIKDYMVLHGYAPTLEDMKRKLNVGSISTVHEHLRRMVKKGYLKKDGYKRGYVLCSPVPISDTLTDKIGKIVFDSLIKYGVSTAIATQTMINVQEELGQQTIKV